MVAGLAKHTAKRVKTAPMSEAIVNQTIARTPAEDADSGVGAWEHVSFSIVHAFAAGLLTILRLRGLYHVARGFGTIEWLVNYKRRRRFAAALEAVLGRRPTGYERRRHTREYFCQNRCDRLFYLIFDRIPRDQAAGLLTFHNRELFDEAVARGRGVYTTLAHHGAQHILGLLMPLHGYKVAGVRDRREGALRRFVQSRLDRLYPGLGRARVLFADAFPRETYRCLQEGYALGSALDISRVRDANQKHEEVEIFGQRRFFPTGPIRIALHCRSPVLQAFVLPEPGFRYRFDVVGILIDPDAVEEEAAAVRQAIHTYAKNVEAQTRARPSLISRV